MVLLRLKEQIMETKNLKTLKENIEIIHENAKKIEGNTKKMESIADKAKQFTNSEAMNWFMGFKV